MVRRLCLARGTFRYLSPEQRFGGELVAHGRSAYFSYETVGGQDDIRNATIDIGVWIQS
jgi:hypothetical protein